MDLRGKIRTLEDEKAEKETDISKLKQKYDDQIAEIEVQNNRKATYEKTIKELRKQIEVGSCAILC